jgi:hypothetical protein
MEPSDELMRQIEAFQRAAVKRFANRAVSLSIILASSQILALQSRRFDTLRQT